MPEESPDQPETPGRTLLRQLDRGSVGLVLMTPDGAVLETNRGAAMLGGEASSASGPQNVEKHFPHTVGGILRDMARKAANSGKVEICDMPPSEETGTSNVRILSVPVPQSQEQEILLILLNTSSEENPEFCGQKRTGSLTMLAGGMAHHFNNILGGVSTVVDYALRTARPADMLNALQETARAMVRAKRLTRGLLNYAEHRPSHAEPVELAELLEELVGRLQPQMARQGISLHRHIATRRAVRLDGEAMRRVLNQLLANARDALAGENGEIRIELHPLSDQVARLQISDTGCGMDRETLGMCFEPFFSTKGLHSGGEGENPGLGLSIAYGLVRDMQGTIRIRSTPRNGTTVDISVPYDPPEK